MRELFSKASGARSTEITCDRLDEIVAKNSAIVGQPARAGYFVSRADVEIADDEYIHLDISSGQGSFPAAINIDQESYLYVHHLGVTPHFICVADWELTPLLPFEDDFADRITLIGVDTSMENYLICEIARCIRPGGVIELSALHEHHKLVFQRIAEIWGVDFEEVAEPMRGVNPGSNAAATETFYRIRVPYDKAPLDEIMLTVPTDHHLRH